MMNFNELKTVGNINQQDEGCEVLLGIRYQMPNAVVKESRKDGNSGCFCCVFFHLLPQAFVSCLGVTYV